MRKKSKKPAPPVLQWCARCRAQAPIGHVCPSRNAADLAHGRMAVVGVRMDKRMLESLDALAVRRKGDSYYGPTRSLLVTEAVVELLKREGLWKREL